MRSRALILVLPLAALAGCGGSSPGAGTQDGGAGDGDGGRPDGAMVTPETSPLDETCLTALTGPFEASLPAPADVVVEEDDHAARFTWDGSLGRSSDELVQTIEGYRICWGPSETDLRHATLVTERIGQVFGVPNGAPQVAVIQAVDARGRVSAPSAVLPFTGDPTRVDALAARMTGFFDRFDTPGPLDELRWNVAFSLCNDPTVSHTFVNELGHAISLLGNHSYLPGSEPGCDRDQNIARPRAIFDFTGREGTIAFDFDGADGDRSTWYVDVFPYAVQDDLQDITGHVTFDPGHGHPGRFLRFSQAGDHLMIHQLDATGEPVNFAETHFFYDAPDQQFVPGGAMRHVELRVSAGSAAIWVDGVLLLENLDVALDYERAVVHWSQFGYNPTKIGRPWNMFHWDNFGFDGPPSTDVVTHNYKTSWNRTDRVDVGFPDNANTWALEIPDALAGATEARFFYSIQTHIYQWEPTDRVVINGTSVPLPEPTSPVGTWEDADFAADYPPFSANIPIPLAALRTGTNTFEFEAANTTMLNLHVEVDFPAGAAPAFTQPAAYLAGSPVPTLGPIGPSVWINARDRELVSTNVPWTETVPEHTLLEFPAAMSGVVPIFVVAENGLQAVTYGRNLGVARVELLVDGVVVSSVETAASVAAPGIYDGPFWWNQPHDGGIELPLDTTALTNGAHTLTVRAFDSAGTMSRPGYGEPGINGASPDEDAPVTFTVAN